MLDNAERQQTDAASHEPQPRGDRRRRTTPDRRGSPVDRRVSPERRGNRSPPDRRLSRERRGNQRSPVDRRSSLERRVRASPPGMVRRGSRASPAERQQHRETAGSDRRRGRTSPGEDRHPAGTQRVHRSRSNSPRPPATRRTGDSRSRSPPEPRGKEQRGPTDDVSADVATTQKTAGSERRRTSPADSGEDAGLKKRKELSAGSEEVLPVGFSFR